MRRNQVPVCAGIRNTRLHRRLEQIEKLDQKKKRQVLQLIDTIIEGEKFRKKASG